MSRRDTADARWLASLAHEMRSPLAAILGYQELLEEGTFGDITPAARDAATRTRAAALQLLALADGMDRVAADPDVFDEPFTPAAVAEVAAAAVEAIAADAAARDVRVVIEADAAALPVRRGEAVRALALALSAALKVSAGGELRIACAASDDGAVFHIHGTRLDASRDDAHSLDDAARSGAALRLYLARATARAANAAIHLSGEPDSATLTLRIRRPVLIDGAEDHP